MLCSKFKIIFSNQKSENLNNLYLNYFMKNALKIDFKKIKLVFIETISYRIIKFFLSNCALVLIN